ncbi:Mei5p PWA37_000659 [Arxiozyma heterogenica]|uniref:Meiosis protein 5 n=1 Tax=Arxiozyma heterogenica TaxID=278026 RepID=A0AAN7WMF1_9SACH|nr:hypothetical protein RI543_004394 [Kazachstania heterogenica]
MSLDSMEMERENANALLVQSTPKPSKVQKHNNKPFQCPFKKGKIMNSIESCLDKSIKLKMDNNTKNTYSSKNALSIKIEELKQALIILNKYDKEINTRKLTQKWRCITQAAMSYILNMTLCKIDKIGGYQQLRKKEFDLQKKRLEYMMDDSMQDEIDTVVESEDFKSLPIDDQVEYKKMMDERLKDFQIHKQNELQKLEKQMNDTTSNEMDMKELADRLKIDYKMVFDICG